MGLTQVSEKGIKDGEILNADINASAAIAGTKVSPDFGSQNIATTGTLACGDITSSDGNGNLTLKDNNHTGNNTEHKINFTASDNTDLINFISPFGEQHLRLRHGSTELVKFQIDGKVGIGTTGPNELLEVAGNCRLSSGGATRTLHMGPASSGLEYNVNGTTFIQGRTDAYPLAFKTNSSERMRIDSSGHLLINTTSVGGGSYDQLSVAGGIKITDDSNSKLEIGRYSSGAPNSYIKIGSNSNSLRITNAADSSDLLTFNNDGKVGIGTSSPDRKLDVSGTGNVYGKFQSTNATGAGIELKDTGENWLIQADGGGANSLAFYDLGNTSYRVHMKSDGNVEIVDGNLKLASGHGIDFSATTNYGTGSNRAELLDDYEEGQFEPAFSTPNGQILRYTYRGEYCKIGRVVHCMWSISSNGTSGTTSGQVTITGFPFSGEVPSANGPRGGGGVIYGGYGSPSTLSRSYIQGTTLYIILNDGSHLEVSDATNTGGNGFQMSGMITYLTTQI